MKVTGLLMGLASLVWTAAAFSLEDIKCVAKVTNRTFQVVLRFNEGATSYLEVKTDNGYEHAGAATYNYSPRLGYHYFHLPAGFDYSLELRVETGGAKRVALCLKSNECYLCR